MYIQREKELEDYICDNQEEFISQIKKTLELDEDKEIQFLGRQVTIGNYIADLIYYYKDVNIIEFPDKEVKIHYINYIIVELKYNKLQPKDFSQLSKYMSVLQDKLTFDENYYGYDFSIKGILLGDEADNNAKELIINSTNDNIYYMSFEPKYKFYSLNYSHNENYIKNLQLDKRINDLYKEEK